MTNINRNGAIASKQIVHDSQVKWKVDQETQSCDEFQMNISFATGNKSYEQRRSGNS